MITKVGGGNLKVYCLHLEGHCMQYRLGVLPTLLAPILTASGLPPHGDPSDHRGVTIGLAGQGSGQAVECLTLYQLHIIKTPILRTGC